MPSTAVLAGAVASETEPAAPASWSSAAAAPGEVELAASAPPAYGSGTPGVELPKIEAPSDRVPVPAFVQDARDSSSAAASTPRPNSAAGGAAAPDAALRSHDVVQAPSAAAAIHTSPPATMPPVTAPPSAAGAPSTIDLLAFGKTMEALQARHGRDVLEVVLVAQQEHLTTLAQFYGEQLERSVRRLSDELTSESVTEIGELFHRSAGEITGALARTERLSAKLLEKQNLILEALGTLGDRVVAELRDLGAGIARSLASIERSRETTAREPERRLQIVSARTDVLEAICEDLDCDDES